MLFAIKKRHVYIIKLSLAVNKLNTFSNQEYHFITTIYRIQITLSLFQFSLRLCLVMFALLSENYMLLFDSFKCQEKPTCWIIFISLRFLYCMSLFK
jgi:hypothetical protein